MYAGYITLNRATGSLTLLKTEYNVYRGTENKPLMSFELYPIG